LRAVKQTLMGLAACGVLLVGCGDDSDDSAAREATERAAGGGAEASTSDADPAVRRRGPRVKLRDSQLGPVLFDGRNRALYLFTRDSRNRSRCYGACAAAWPPFLARGRPRAAGGVRQSLLGTIRRRGGTRQVTYKGQPLYFYIDDPRGQVLCNNVPEFGGTWYALNTEGDPPS
jgi:predicted lipoprotein with Yx(FWY)xxD motif